MHSQILLHTCLEANKVCIMLEKVTIGNIQVYGCIKNDSIDNHTNRENFPSILFQIYLRVTKSLLCERTP